MNDDQRQVIVDNRPGAGTGVGAKRSYDPKDLAPMGLVAAVPFMLVVNPSLNVRSLEEFVVAAKNRSCGLTYGSAGNGSPHHLIAEMFKAATGIPASGARVD